MSVVITSKTVYKCLNCHLESHAFAHIGWLVCFCLHVWLFTWSCVCAGAHTCACGDQRLMTNVFLCHSTSIFRQVSRWIPTDLTSWIWPTSSWDLHPAPSQPPPPPTKHWDYRYTPLCPVCTLPTKSPPMFSTEWQAHLLANKSAFSPTSTTACLQFWERNDICSFPDWCAFSCSFSVQGNPE